MNVRLRACAASLILLGLPVADFIRDGDVADTLLVPLLILAFGSGGYAADKAVKRATRKREGDRDA